MNTNSIYSKYNNSAKMEIGDLVVFYYNSTARLGKVDQKISISDSVQYLAIDSFMSGRDLIYVPIYYAHLATKMELAEFAIRKLSEMPR